MLSETKSPVTLAGVNRAGNIKTVSAGFDGAELTGDTLACQVAVLRAFSTCLSSKPY